jgi:hypothetical protein
MWHLARPLKFRFFFAITSAATLLATSGCRDAIENSGEDNAFIRQPGTKSVASNKVKQKTGPLLPTKIGSTWRNRINFRRISAPVNGNQDPSVDDNGVPFIEAYEKAVMAGPSPLAGGGSGVRIDMRPDMQNKINRTETFRVDKSGIYFSRIGGGQTLDALPPVPLITYPIQEDQIKKWTGTLRFNSKSYPAQGYIRVGSAEEVTLPQGKVIAYRVDTALTANIDGRPASFPITRWFAPGIGIIRQHFIEGNLQISKEVDTYKI